MLPTISAFYHKGSPGRRIRVLLSLDALDRSASALLFLQPALVIPPV